MPILFSWKGLCHDLRRGWRQPAASEIIIRQPQAPALWLAVMRDDVDINLAQFVHGTHQLHFLVPGEIAQIQDFQIAECDENALRPRIFSLVDGLRFGFFASGIWVACAVQGTLDQSTIRTDDSCMHSQNGQDVSWFYRDVFEFLGGEQFLIGRPILKCGCDAGFAIVAVIDEGVDRNACHQLGKAIRARQCCYPCYGKRSNVVIGESGRICVLRIEVPGPRVAKRRRGV